ncbi:MAG: hypothetical protein JSW41_01785 [Candidatus Aenigmatarchaeota archaeon]|nr:MAG: hypothetical protein JSW41_01785 [Candidatus Aenigmarchaeota archaeon]
MVTHVSAKGTHAGDEKCIAVVLIEGGTHYQIEMRPFLLFVKLKGYKIAEWTEYE